MDAHVINDKKNVNVTKNGVCVDWFEFTLKLNGDFWGELQFDYMVEFLGLDDANLSWKPGYAQNGYKSCMIFDHIFILYNPTQSDMGVHCRMTGQGCRAFEKYSSLADFRALMKQILLFNSSPDGLSDENNSKISRLDIAYDDFEGIIDIPAIYNAVQDPVNCIVSRWRKAISKQGINLSTGEVAYTVDFGRQASDCWFTIYDKLQERKSKNLMPDCKLWNRAELKLRNNKAWNFIEHIISGKSMIEVYFLVINNMIRIVEKSDSDSNRWRWPMAEHWRRFACSVLDDRICLHSAVEDNYTENKLEDYVIGQAGAAIYTYIKHFTIYDLIEMVKNKCESENYVLATKYKELLRDPEDPEDQEVFSE